MRYYVINEFAQIILVTLNKEEAEETAFEIDGEIMTD